MQRVLLPIRTITRNPDLVVLLACGLLLGLAYSFVTPFLSIFGTIEVGMRPMVFGFFMTASSLSAIVVSTMLARWSDTHASRRTILMLGTGSGVLAYVGFAFVRNVAGLTVIGTTVLAVSMISFSQLFAHGRDVLARSTVPAAQTPLYMNMLRLSFALAWTVGPAIASWVMIAYSFRGLFLTAASVFFILMLVIARFVPKSESEGGALTKRVRLRDTLRRADLLAYFIGFILIFIASSMSIMNLPLYVLKTLHGSKHDVGVIFSLAPIFELPLMFYFGLLASRRDQTGIIRVGALIALTYYVALTLVRAPWHIYPLQMLGAAATAVISGIAITFFQNYLPGQAGSATNLYATAQRIGSTIGFLSFGLLVTTVGHRGVFVVCASLCATALSLLFFHSRKEADAKNARAEDEENARVSDSARAVIAS